MDQRNYLEDRPEEAVRFTKAEMDVFLSLSDWYNDAIIELLRTKGFESQSVFVAKRLGMSLEEADSALKRLFHLGILKKLQNKEWAAPAENTIIYGDDQTNFALLGWTAKESRTGIY